MKSTTFRAATLALALGGGHLAAAQTLSPAQQLAHDILKELVEINTVTATGDTAKAADAVAARLRAGGFSGDDVQVFYPAPRKGNLVARLHGSGKRKPILLLAHLDVVEAKLEDWTTDPFQFVEKEGVYYGRGVLDDKAMAAIFVANLIAFKQEGYKPDRDIVLVLETDEETGDQNALGMRWLIQNHRELIDAAFALNEDGYAYSKDGKPYLNDIQASEKVGVYYQLESKNPGGHASLPSRDNAIYHIADALGRLEKFDFPVRLNETSRAYFAEVAKVEQGKTAADMRAVTATPPDADAAARLSAKRPLYNAQLHATCVATMLEGGHARGALPQVARATVNCRALPGESVEEMQQTLVDVVADDKVAVTQLTMLAPSPPSPLTGEIMDAIRQSTAKVWPGIPVVVSISPGATDGRFLRNAGIPSYSTSGLMIDIGYNRKHGQDESLPANSFFDGQEYQYWLVKGLSGGASN